MNKESKVEPEDLIGIYSEMAQLIGAEAVTKIYVHFKRAADSFSNAFVYKGLYCQAIKWGRKSAD